MLSALTAYRHERMEKFGAAELQEFVRAARSISTAVSDKDYVSGALKVWRADASSLLDLPRLKRVAESTEPRSFYYGIRGDPPTEHMPNSPADTTVRQLVSVQSQKASALGVSQTSA